MHDRPLLRHTQFHNNKAKQTRSSKINSNKESSSNAEKMKKWREQKIAKKKEADRKYYKRNRERKIVNVKEYKRKTGQTKVGVTRRSQQLKQKEFVAKKKKQDEKDVKEERKEKIQQQTRERVRRLREKRRNEICQNLDEDTANRSTSTFPNRMAKTRALKKTNEALPKTPEKKAEPLKPFHLVHRQETFFKRKA